jgi:hypothetical protein
MLEFKVSAFYQATYELNDLATWVEARKHDPIRRIIQTSD